jgi:hypothetical protein
MPCYQVNLISVEFKAKHVNLLEAAARELGWAYSAAGRYVVCGMIKVDLEQQTATSASVDVVNRLKVEYSRQAVLTMAKKKKWFVKQESNRKMELRRY